MTSGNMVRLVYGTFAIGQLCLLDIIRPYTDPCRPCYYLEVFKAISALPSVTVFSG